MLEALPHVELIRLNGAEEFGLGPRGGLAAAEAAALRVLNRYPITRLDDLHIYQQRESATLARLVQEPVAPYDLVIGFMEVGRNGRRFVLHGGGFGPFRCVHMNPKVTHIRHIEGPSSWRSRALTTMLRVASRGRLRHDVDLLALRQRYEAFDARHAPLVPGMVRQAVQCDGVAAEWITVPESRPDRTLLYLHGGSFAFRFPNTHAAFAARICRILGARALVPDYRLVPEHTFPAAPDDCHTAYRWLLTSGCPPNSLVVMGDSAGGCLALVTLIRARQAHDPQPACTVLLSPAVDCTFDSHSMVDNEGRDPLFRLSDLLVLRRHYVPSPHLYTHPEVSPLFADFDGLSPLLLQVGSNEMLRDEAIRTTHKAHVAGVDVELELWPDMPHVFQSEPFIPESNRALRHIAAFVAARTGWSLATGGTAARATAQLLPVTARSPHSNK